MHVSMTQISSKSVLRFSSIFDPVVNSQASRSVIRPEQEPEHRLVPYFPVLVRMRQLPYEQIEHAPMHIYQMLRTVGVRDQSVCRKYCIMQ